ncbi:chromosome transmission fidelity protein 1 [Nematocida minor]|uniref:chromosome transmission fidelity protein 1 n=1 Tax=Nematocida minor TaxID=1912983 RepID=UPI002220EECA|nr:chromosome transmission fidelity protein 1 [Nematocida minor]KAI5189905.1 chromosome transmission fidelity protein 1 [Nematocida minor]
MDGSKKCAMESAKKQKISETDEECAEFMKKFNFSLYEGQKQFVKDAVRIINRNGLAALESPTGTGKTRSILLAAMYYTKNSYFLPEGISQENMALLRDLYSKSTKHVVYACRTHSQLEQVISELKYLNKMGNMSVKGVVLGSRKQTCINPRVNTSKDINNLCRLLVKDKKCVYYNNLKKPVESKKTEISIEKAVALGKECGVCPYFYLKKQAASASIIILPYSLLLKRDFFKEIGINKAETVLVIDEAHNLYNAVLEEYTVQILYADVEKMLPFYRSYMDKASGLFKTELLELYMFIEGLCGYIEKTKKEIEISSESKSVKEKSKILNVNKFLLECEIDHINLLDTAETLNKYTLASRIFPIRSENVQNENEDTLNRIGKLCKLLGECERNSYIVMDGAAISFKNIYPAEYLTYLEDIKSIITVGGTLYPCTDIKLLFDREVVQKSYPAVCKNIKVDICTDYLFTYSDRTEKLLHAYDLAKTYLKSISNGGVLVFVQSKDAMSRLKEELNKRAEREDVPTESVLFEGDMPLEHYKKVIDSERKAIMFCVMGGNFSEGINFGDDLCRILIVCGIPLPKPTNETALIEKHRGSEYYIEKGMQTVNQTIGRAVRSKNDYSYVVLLDKRFVKYKTKLSPWLQPHINITNSRNTLEDIPAQLRRWNLENKEQRSRE